MNLTKPIESFRCWLKSKSGEAKPKGGKLPKSQRNAAAKERAAYQGLEPLESRIAPASLSIANISISEGDSGTKNATFTVSLDAPAIGNIMVHYATSDGGGAVGAKDAIDYTSVQGDLTFHAGDQSLTFVVPVIGNTTAEVDKSFVVDLSNPTNAVIGIGTGHATGTILNDDTHINISDARLLEGNSGTSSANFLVTLDAPQSFPVTVHYATANGTATDGGNYHGVTGDLTFAAGETSKTVSVPVIGDTTAAADKTFSLNLSAPANATLARTSATGTILNDDTSANTHISVADVRLLEGNSGTNLAGFVITLNKAQVFPVTVHYATADGTGATAGTDYTNTFGDITFAAGQTSKTVNVPVIGDIVAQADKTFSLNLSTPGHAVLTKLSATGTILNDDTSDNTHISVADVTLVEGNSGTSNADFVITLDTAQAFPVTVHYATANGSGANAGVDYTNTLGDITFAAGQTSKTVSVPVIGNTTASADKTFSLNLSAPGNAVLTKPSATGTVQNDDGSISVGDIAFTEGNSLGKSVTFQLTLAFPSVLPVTVHYQTADGSAHAGTDYVSATGDVTFAPGTTVMPVTVAINGDTVASANKTFSLKLSAPVNAALAKTSATGTILNDDTSDNTHISVADVELVEGNSGTHDAGFVITLDQAQAFPVTVHYATADGNGTAAGVDYTNTFGDITFAAGQTSKTVNVPVTGNTVATDDKTFSLNLDAPGNAVLTKISATGTILNDDTSDNTHISVADVTLVEGNSGTSNADFVITLDTAQAFPVTFHYATANGTGTTTGVDYSNTFGDITFAAGETTKTVSVPVIGDTVAAADKTFSLNLGAPGNAVLTKTTATGTIQNDDASVSVADIAFTEGNSLSKNVTFQVTLAYPSVLPVTVHFQTADGTAVAGTDYDATSGDVTFPAGTTVMPVTIAIHGDTVATADKTFSLNLSATDNSILAKASATGTILNDDTGDNTQIRVADVKLLEGQSGTRNASFVITLDTAQAFPVSVHYSTADGPGAIAGVDYTNTFGDITFAAGETSKTVTVPVIGDGVPQADKMFSLNLDAPGNAVLTKTSATGTIQNDDTAVSVSNINIVEGNSGTSNADFVITLDSPQAFPVTVHYATADGTGATDGVDYHGVSGDVTFAIGETSKTVSVPVIGDAIHQGDRTFLFKLSNPVNAALANASATGSIQDDDVSISVGDVTLTEGNTGTKTATFQLKLDYASPLPVTVHYHTVDGTAIAGTDYGAKEGDITFAAGTTVMSVSVVINGNTIADVNKAFTLELSDPVNATLSDASATGTIVNDDLTLPSTGALSLSADHKQFGFTDLDGDLVIVKSSKALFSESEISSAFHFRASLDNSQQFQLEGIDYTALNASLQAKSDLTFTVIQTGGGDGLVNIGFIKATKDLGSITIPGDLGKIQVGDNEATQGLKLLDVHTIGKLGTSTGASDLISNFTGPVGTIHVRGDVTGAQLNFLNAAFVTGNGSIGLLNIEGSLIGGDAASSGTIHFTGTLAKAVIGGIQGGAGATSGAIESGTATLSKISNILVNGDVIGGAGANSGEINSPVIGSVVIKGDLQGGSGDASGVIKTTSLGKVVVGVSGLSDVGSVIGGHGTGSGAIVSTGDMASVQIFGDLQGAEGNGSGQINSSGKLKSVTINGSLLGGMGTTSGSILSSLAIGTIKIGQDIKGDAGQFSGEIASGDTLGSVTVLGSLLGGTAEFSGFISAGTNLGAIKITHDLIGGTAFGAGSIIANGKLGSVSIGDSLQGKEGDNSGAIFSGADPGLAGDMGKVTIGLDIQGGLGTNSGQINSGGNIASMTVGRSLKGDQGDASGAILSVGTMGPIKVISGILGGSGSDSGQISGFKLGAVTIGGSLIGGAGNGSGAILSHTLFEPEADLQGNIGTINIGGGIEGGSGVGSGQINAAGTLAGVTIGLSVTGGSGDGSGCILSGTDYVTSGAMGAVKIKGDLQGGSVTGSESLDQSGYIAGQRIASVTIGGSVISGVNYGSGILTKSGSIRADDDIGAVNIQGGLQGDPSNPLILSARGQAVPGRTTDVAIKSLTVGTTVQYANILAGYDSDLNALNFDAQIGAIKVLNKAVNGFTAVNAWIASSVVAGVYDADHNGFGTSGDALIPGDDTPNIVSKIASILIAGDISGTTGTDFAGDHFGFVAQQIGSFKFGTTPLLLKTAGIPDVFESLGTTNDTSLREIAV